MCVVHDMQLTESVLTFCLTTCFASKSVCIMYMLLSILIMQTNMTSAGYYDRQI